MSINRQITTMLAGAAMAGLLTACMEHAGSGSQPIGQMSPPSGSSSRVDLIIRNAKQEVANLRADLGAARIAAAKKEVEVEEMRRDMTHSRQRVAELQQGHDQQHYAVEKQQVELVALKTDRDRLQRENSDMQRTLAEVPALREALSASRMADGQIQARVKELENTLASVNEELATVRAVAMEREEKLSQHRSSRHAALSVPPSKNDVKSGVGSVTDGVKDGLSVASMGKDGAVDAVVYFANSISVDPGWAVVTVKPGDTLGDLARAHGATISQVKDANGLTRDVIRSGQLLRIPLRHQK